ncbi:MAG: RNase adapter RapZ [Firmicutes bacterium]|nr:RNase adapter RapZ [Bacillota bacterium]
MDKMEVVILTGLSGAGKTNAIDWFEDQNYYCVDNMPPSLIISFIDLTVASKKKINKAAFVVDIRGGVFFDDFKECIDELKGNPNIDCKILFLDASERTLVKRFNETRRDHPLAAGGPTNRAVIAKEKEMLSDIRDMSDYIIDTTNLKVTDLKSEIGRIFGEEGDSVFAINVMSFGYKRGLPSESDVIFDMRFIANPYHVQSLRKLTGRNKKVFDYVFKQPVAIKFAEDLAQLLEDMIPSYIKEGKQHINLAFGCTGGQHRSVAMAEKMSRVLKEKGYRTTLEHRDIK